MSGEYAAVVGDNILIQRMSDGDRDALGELYDRYSRLMVSVSIRWFGNLESAEDLVHDVFLEAWGKAHTYDPRRSSVKSWLMLRLRSRAIDRFRSLGRFQEEELSEIVSYDVEFDETFGQKIDVEILRGHFSVLNKEQIEVMESVYFFGESGPEAAVRLGIPLGTVKSRLASALRLLREAVRVSHDSGTE